MDGVSQYDVSWNLQSLPPNIFVIGTSEHPIPGWINNLYGPTGVVAGVGSGLLRVLQVSTELRADLVPVDMTVNALICVAWDVHNKYSMHGKIKKNILDKEQLTASIRHKTSKLPVYNFVTSSTNPVTWNNYLKYSMKHGMKIPPVKAMWYITLTTTKSEALYKFLILLYHYLPAFFIDGVLKLIGKRTRMLKMYQKIHKFSNVISYFTMRQWIFENENIEKLWLRLNRVDRNEFHFDMKTLDWNSYFERTIVGLRKYLFHDDESTISFAKKKMLFLFICHRLLQTCIVGLIVWIVFL